MKVLLQNTFSSATLIMLIISAVILIFIDCKEFKEKGFIKEYKVSKVFAIFFLVGGTGMYVIMRFIVK